MNRTTVQITLAIIAFIMAGIAWVQIGRDGHEQVIDLYCEGYAPDSDARCMTPPRTGGR